MFWHVLTEYFLNTGVDQCIQKFLDVARQIECFFLQKRFQLSVQKPEQVVKEVIYYPVLTVVSFIYTRHILYDASHKFLFV